MWDDLIAENECLGFHSAVLLTFGAAADSPSRLWCHNGGIETARHLEPGITVRITYMWMVVCESSGAVGLNLHQPAGLSIEDVVADDSGFTPCEDNTKKTSRLFIFSFGKISNF